jgi:hypothetical protein
MLGQLQKIKLYCSNNLISLFCRTPDGPTPQKEVENEKNHLRDNKECTKVNIFKK